MIETIPVIEQDQQIQLITYVKPEAIPFLTSHGCIVRQQQHGGNVVIFPSGSRKEPISSSSQICSTITLPDGTIITAMDCYTKYILLVIDLVHGSGMHLSN